jgi:hypothetical protein
MVNLSFPTLVRTLLSISTRTAHLTLPLTSPTL